MTQTDYWGIFDRQPLSFNDLMLLQKRIRKTRPYLIFFTARSGSSYLIDLLTKTDQAGQPGEYFNPKIIPRALAGIKRRHGVHIENIIEYLMWLIKNRGTSNGGFGFKATYHHYQPFILTGLDRLFFSEFKLFYLYRENILKQAVSLYVMSETRLAHKHKEVSNDILTKVDNLSYDKGKIQIWIKHIWDQERGLKKYFKRPGLDVQVIEYGQLSANPDVVIKNILSAIGASTEVEIGRSSFKKVRGSKNELLAAEFLRDEDNLMFLKENGIPLSRVEGD